MCLAWCYASTLLGGVFVLFCRNAIRRLGLWKSLPPLGLVVLAIGYGIFTGFQYELYWQWWIVLAALLAFAYLLRSFTFLAGSLCWLGGIHIVRTLLACLRETLLFFAPMERGAMLKFGIVFRTMAVGTKRMAEGKGTPGRRRRHAGVAWRGSDAPQYVPLVRIPYRKSASRRIVSWPAFPFSDAPLKYKNGTCTVKEYFCQEKKQKTENEEANDCRPEYESGSRERSVNGVQIWSVGPDGKDDDDQVRETTDRGLDPSIVEEISEIQKDDIRFTIPIR